MQFLHFTKEAFNLFDPQKVLIATSDESDLTVSTLAEEQQRHLKTFPNEMPTNFEMLMEILRRVSNNLQEVIAIHDNGLPYRLIIV